MLSPENANSELCVFSGAGIEVFCTVSVCLCPPSGEWSCVGESVVGYLLHGKEVLISNLQARQEKLWIS